MSDLPVTDPAPLLVDSRGRLCPLPVIDLARAARDAGPGTVLELLADDPAAASDVAAWCTMRGHELVSTAPVAADGATRPATPPATRPATRYLVRLG